MTEFEWNPLWLTAKLSAVSTLTLLVAALPLSYWLALGKSRARIFVSPLISLPMVLPPTVLGFYLLSVFTPDAFLGGFFENYLGISLVFSFSGLVAGAVISGLPFMVQPLLSGLEQLPPSLAEASYTLGKNKFLTFFKVQLPNMLPSLFSALILTFCHNMGNFGVLLMLGGSIPGETKVASIAIYQEVEALRYGNAHRYSLILSGFSFLFLVALQYFKNRGGKTA